MAPIDGRGAGKTCCPQARKITKINRADYSGSFIVRVYALLPSKNEVEVGREAILSRWQIAECRNCWDKVDITSAVIAIDKRTLDAIQGGD